MTSGPSPRPDQHNRGQPRHTGCRTTTRRHPVIVLLVVIPLFALHAEGFGASTAFGTGARVGLKWGHSKDRGGITSHECSISRHGLRRGRVEGLKMVIIRPVTSEEEVRGLSLLCLESFYGPVKALDYLNPIGALQRGLVMQQVEQDLSMRVRRYKQGLSSGRVCGTCLCAIDEETGLLAGFVDLSLTIYDQAKGRFSVANGPGTVALEPGSVRRPYLANLAVAPRFHRQGVARRLVQSVEAEVVKYTDEMREAAAKGELVEGAGTPGMWDAGLWLEVSASNTAALGLYKSLGYQVAWQDNEAREVVRKAFTYEFGRVVRICLYKCLIGDVDSGVQARGDGREEPTGEVP